MRRLVTRFTRLTRLTLLTLFTLLTSFALTAAVEAQEVFPTKPVRIIVPFAPGGGTDTLARFVGKVLGERWGHSVAIENRPGGEGVIGSQAVAQASPDGYTLLWAVQSHTIMPAMRASMPFDTERAFAPISLVATTPFVVAASLKLPAKNMVELIALAKASPGKLSYGSSDPAARVMGEMLKNSASIDILNVPYKGSGPILTDLLGGQIDLGFVSLPSAMPNYKAGKIRLLGVSTIARSPYDNSIPTLAESGMTDFHFPIWWGLLARAGTPTEIVTKIHRDLMAASDNPEFRDGLTRVGAAPVLGTPQEFATFIANELAKAARTVRAAGIKPE